MEEPDFDRLFRAEYSRVAAIANRVLADPAEAEDVAQEVFLSFHRLHSPAAGYAPAWLHRAASHTALNRLRERKRRLRRELASAGPASDGTDPAAEAMMAADAERVRDALRRLPRKSAAVLALRYSGLSYAEVAAALGVGIGQVGTLLRRAEKRLRAEVEQ